MNSDLTSLEAQLCGLCPAPLDEGLLDRLDNAAEGLLTHPGADEMRFESHLRAQAPAALSADLLASLEGIVRDVPFVVNQKIVAFPNARPGTKRETRRRPIWGAAAAVAVIGAASALLMPTGKPVTPGTPLASNSTPAATIPPVTSPAPNNTSSNLVPASFNRGLSEVHDEGVVWKSNNQPHSLVRVVYSEKLTATDKQGRTYQVQRPKVEYMLVPAKTD